MTTATEKMIHAYVEENKLVIPLSQGLREKLQNGDEVEANAIDLESKTFLRIRIQDRDKVPGDMRRSTDEILTKISETEKAYRNSISYCHSGGSLLGITDALEWAIRFRDELDLQEHGAH